MKQAQTQSEVSTKMAKTTLDAMKAEGAQILEMMESVPKPSPTSLKGSVVDINRCESIGSQLTVLSS
jgi:hypothetical protein